ncbi:glycosyltransferase [Conexibacter sp. W3-3-2]|uniref:Glycosyltransferase n=2 Tax=Thermoleophilia TaxID=1497346 RepID=A0A2T4UNJ1_9ACTN|nr:glycosyltransferase [Conexibacter sp. W3-3-2]PTL60778.1 glycosyltransferase [Paraconexibacter algicola]
MYDEAQSVRPFVERVFAALADEDVELIVVDDGSVDGTAQALAELAAQEPRLVVVELSRNFGHQAAITAGLDHARGAVAVTIDADLQDPPELIPVLLTHWRAGADVVSAVRTSRPGETRFKLRTADAFYRVLSRVADIEVQQNAGDFRLLDRRALDGLRAMRESNRYLRGMTSWVGYVQTTVPYERSPRHAGETKYPLRKMVRLGLDAIVSFSHAPLQVATIVGFVSALLAFLAIPVAVGFRIAGQFVPGVTTTVIAVLLLGGIQLMAIGVIGEYVGRIYDEVKQRPLYLVGRVRNRPDAEED